MSGNALRDLNIVPASKINNGGSSKESFTKPCNGNTNENMEGSLAKKSINFAAAPCNGDMNPANEIVNVEVEYIESENLNDMEDAITGLKTLLAGLESKDWIMICDALNNVRRLSIFHKEEMLEIVGDVIPLIVKSLKNPRSAVCKTACMTSADIFIIYNDHIIDMLEPLLAQLLLKSSQDKRFVCEAAEKALISMTCWVSPALLLPKLQPCLKNRNPRVRAKASMCFCRSVTGLGVEGIKAYGIEKLIQVAASQLSDQLPESREGARTLILQLKTAYDKSLALTVSVSDPPDCWEIFCLSKLSPLSAQAVLRVTNITKDGVS